MKGSNHDSMDLGALTEAANQAIMAEQYMVEVRKRQAEIEELQKLQEESKLLYSMHCEFSALLKACLISEKYTFEDRYITLRMLTRVLQCDVANKFNKEYPKGAIDLTKDEANNNNNNNNKDSDDDDRNVKRQKM